MATLATQTIRDIESELSQRERWTRAAVALAFLIYPMLLPTEPLGLIALLPLIAVYPMFSAIVGWDPVRYLLGDSEAHGLSRVAARIGLVVIGTGLIVGVMLTNVHPLGGLTVLALLGIIPITVAIFGENPISALIDSSHLDEEFTQNFDQRQDENQRNVVEYAGRSNQKAAQQPQDPAHHQAA